MTASTGKTVQELVRSETFVVTVTVVTVTSRGGICELLSVNAGTAFSTVARLGRQALKLRSKQRKC